MLYLLGRGRSRDLAKMRELIERGCQAQDETSCYNLAVLLGSPNSVEADPTRASRIFSDQCRRGRLEACVALGIQEMNGSGVLSDPTTAIGRFKTACESSGDATGEGCQNLGLAYWKGTGVVRDQPYAVQLFDRACRYEQPNACYNLGRLHAAGVAASRDLARAKQLFERACRLGSQDACGVLRGERPADSAI